MADGDISPQQERALRAQLGGATNATRSTPTAHYHFPAVKTPPVARGRSFFDTVLLQSPPAAPSPFTFEPTGLSAPQAGLSSLLSPPPKLDGRRRKPSGQLFTANALAPGVSGVPPPLVQPRESFIVVLLRLLNREPNYPDVSTWIRWSRSGKFVIVPNEQLLVTNVASKIFGQSQPASFSRQMNNWGFSREVRRGRDLDFLDPTLSSEPSLRSGERQTKLWRHATLTARSTAAEIEMVRRKKEQPRGSAYHDLLASANFASAPLRPDPSKLLSPTSSLSSLLDEPITPPRRGSQESAFSLFGDLASPSGRSTLSSETLDTLALPDGRSYPPLRRSASFASSRRHRSPSVSQESIRSIPSPPPSNFGSPSLLSPTDDYPYDLTSPSLDALLAAATAQGHAAGLGLGLLDSTPRPSKLDRELLAKLGRKQG